MAPVTASVSAAVRSAGFNSPEVHTLDLVDAHDDKPLPPHYALTASA
jgi:hypothetical protein